MKILVTGGSGFIGRNLVKKLKQEGHEVLVLDKAPAGRYNTFGCNDLKTVGISGCNWFDYGQRDPYDIIFHLGAYVSAANSLEEPRQCYENNFMGTFNILRWFKFKRIVFTSTAALYANDLEGMMYIPKGSELPKQSVSFDTTKLSDLLSPYAKSKMMGEELIKDMADSYAILRLFNVYGKDQNPEYGAVIQSFLKNYNNKEEYTIYGSGDQIRDFVHVDDVVNALIFSAMNDVTFTANVGTGRGVSLNDLQKMFDPEGDVVYKDARNGDPFYSVADTETLNKMGWSSKIEIQQGIKLLKNEH